MLRISTTEARGYDTLSCDLARRIDVDYPDLELFDTVRILGPDGDPVWEWHPYPDEDA